MSELGAKKLAEVQAFITISGEILKRATPAFEESAPNVHSSLLKISQQSLKANVDTEMASVFYEKTEKTIKKLTNMMELYVGDSWDNPTEVLEWSSFFSGAGEAHCAIASKLADDADTNVTLKSLQAEFSKLLQQVVLQLGS